MTDRRSLVRQPWFWWCGGAVALLSAAAAWWMFPKAHALLTLDLRMDRATAVRAAEELARAGQWGPDGEVRSVAMFGGDDYVQAFVELAGGGKPAFAALVQDRYFSPYRWNVRRFRAGETREVEVRFRPEGRPVGFKETLPQAAPGAALPADAARAIAEAAARAAPWNVALDEFAPFGTSATTQPGGRVDHAFTYERLDGALGEGRLRLVLGVSGDRLTSLAHYVHIPEAFGRRYAEMRSINNALASASLGGAALLYGVGGIGVGVFILLRQRQVWWRPALAAAAVFGLLNLLLGLNAWPLGWAGYDTALGEGAFIGQRLVSLLKGALTTGVLCFLTFVAGESLSRRAFPGHAQFWRFWSAPVGATRLALGATAGGLILACVDLGYVNAFYAAATRWLDWWLPSGALVSPNSLAHLSPWFTPVAGALHAGFWEEFAFRAIPLSAAALLGDRFGGRARWIAGALVLQAVVFAAGHANYPGQPAYSRIVELIPPSIVAGLVFLRWGLVPVIIAHFVYDVVLMSLPLFRASGDGVGWDRALVVIVSLLPLWVVVWRRRQRPGAGELAAAERNAGWAPPAASAPGPVEAPAVAPAGVSAGHCILVTVLGVAGLVCWLAHTRVDQPGPPLAIGRAEAERVARAALVERGYTLPPPAVAQVTALPGGGGADRFIWTTAGADEYRALVGTYVPAPRWQVRFVLFRGEVAERAEQWLCLVAGDGRVLTVAHQLPEARAGAKLTADEARARAHEVLRRQFQLEPDALREVSAVRTERPRRTDWTFVFHDVGVTSVTPGQARIRINLAGDEIAAAARYVFQPEEWEREQRQRDVAMRTLSALGGPVAGGLGGVALLLAVLALVRGRFSRAVAVPIGVVVGAVSLLGAVNQMPGTLARFVTTRSYELQLVSALGVPLVTSVLIGVVAALAAGLPVAWLRPPAAAGRRTVAWALALGAIGLGLVALANRLREWHGHTWSTVAAMETWMPWLQPLPGALLNLVFNAAAVLIWFGALDRWTAGFSRRRGAAVASSILLGTLAGLAPGGTSVAALAGAAAGYAVALTAVYVFALRRDLTVVPLAVGLMTVAEQVGNALPRAHPAALPGALVAAVGVSLLAWWWWRALRAAAAQTSATESAEVPVETVAEARGVP